MGAVIIVIILVLIIAILTIYNMSINKKIQDFKNLDKKFTNLNIIQDFVNITGNDMTVDDKIKAINNVIILIIIVQALQMLGNYLYKKLNK